MVSRVLAVVALALSIAACGNESPSEGREVIDRADEIEPGTPTFGVYNALKAMGTPVEVGGEVRQPFFEDRGRILRVNGAEVELFEFDSKEDADEAAEQIGAAGTISGQPAWSAPPHWYRTDRVLMLYLGSDPSVRAALEAAAGSQFAGQ